MKKILVMVMCILFLSACSNEVETIDIELEFLELQKTGDSGKAIFSSNSEETYYELYISSYEYNNWDMEAGDTITVTKEKNGYPSHLLSEELEYDAVWQDNEIELIEVDYFLD